MAAQPAHILVVDDEAPIRLTMRALLQRRGYQVTIAEDGEDALGLIHQRAFDLLLLDLRMPGIGGIDVAKPARERQPDVAIIILTGHGSLDTAIEGLHLQVFDYLLKTASPHDVLQRVETALAERHAAQRQQQLMATLHSVVGELGGKEPAQPAQLAPSAEQWLDVGDLQISLWNQTVRRGEQILNLTPTEFRVLACLAQQAGHVMSYQQIVQCAQGYDTGALEAAELIKPHMYHLRQKLESDPANPRYILTVRGTGYMLSPVPPSLDA